MVKRPNSSETAASCHPPAKQARGSSPIRRRSRESIDTQPLDCEIDTNPDTNIVVRENREGDISNHGALQRDKDYYFTDGSVVLRVEDTLFKVHTSQLGAHSNAFENMFATISTDDSKGSLTEGLCDESPIVRKIGKTDTSTCHRL